MGTISVLGKNEGKILHIAGGQYRTMISGKQSAGKYAVIEMIVPPGAGPAPHAHKDIEEVFYVAAGEVEFRSEQGLSTVIAGDMIRIPLGGAVHAFKNTTNTDATLICTVYPAGLEDMFEQIDRADPLKAKVIAVEFGNQFYPEDYFDKQ